MSTAQVLHPAGFIETGTCEGPRYVRSQPSRETPGVILNEVTDKYVSEFTVPFRNSTRALKTFKMNWDRVPDSDKEKIMTIVGPFTKNVPMNQAVRNIFSGDGTPEPKLTNLKNILDNINHPDESMKQTYSEEEMKNLKNDLREWVVETYWYLILIIVILFIALLATGLTRKH